MCLIGYEVQDCEIWYRDLDTIHVDRHEIILDPGSVTIDGFLADLVLIDFSNISLQIYGEIEDEFVSVLGWVPEPPTAAHFVGSQVHLPPWRRRLVGSLVPVEKREIVLPWVWREEVPLRYERMDWPQLVRQYRRTTLKRITNCKQRPPTETDRKQERDGVHV
jgi:hypothetical protein